MGLLGVLSRPPSGADGRRHLEGPQLGGDWPRAECLHQGKWQMFQTRPGAASCQPVPQASLPAESSVRDGRRSLSPEAGREPAGIPEGKASSAGGEGHSYREKQGREGPSGPSPSFFQGSRQTSMHCPRPHSQRRMSPRSSGSKPHSFPPSTEPNKRADNNHLGAHGGQGKAGGLLLGPGGWRPL